MLFRSPAETHAECSEMSGSCDIITTSRSTDHSLYTRLCHSFREKSQAGPIDNQRTDGGLPALGACSVAELSERKLLPVVVAAVGHVE